MGSALMIPGMVGKNIDKWIKENDLPKTVSEFGTTVEEIFVINMRMLKNIVGSKEINKIPLGAIGIYSYCQKIKSASSSSWQEQGVLILSPLPE
jgi:hypothetical protein